MSKIIKITGISDEWNKAKTSQYMRINNEFNVFDEPIKEIFRNNFNKNLEVNFKTSPCGKYQNLVGEPIPTNEDTSQPIIVKPSHTLPAQTAPEAHTAPVKQNSRSWGVGSDCVKIYHEDGLDLRRQIDNIKAFGLMPTAYYKCMKEAQKASEGGLRSEATAEVPAEETEQQSLKGE